MTLIINQIPCMHWYEYQFIIRKTGAFTGIELCGLKPEDSILIQGKANVVVERWIEISIHTTNELEYVTSNLDLSIRLNQKITVRNNRDNGQHGVEERVGECPMKLGDSFEVRIIAHSVTSKRNCSFIRALLYVTQNTQKQRTIERKLAFVTAVGIVCVSGTFFRQTPASSLYSFRKSCRIFMHACFPRVLRRISPAKMLRRFPIPKSKAKKGLSEDPSLSRLSPWRLGHFGLLRRPAFLIYLFIRVLP